MQAIRFNRSACCVVITGKFAEVAQLGNLNRSDKNHKDSGASKRIRQL
jgi:hypothetical protein